MSVLVCVYVCVCAPLIVGSFGRCQLMREHGQGCELPHSASLSALVGMVPVGIGHDGERDSEDDVPWAGTGTSLVEDSCHR